MKKDFSLYIETASNGYVLTIRNGYDAEDDYVFMLKGDLLAKIEGLL